MTASLPPIWLLIVANGLIWLVIFGVVAFILWRRRLSPHRYLRTPEAAKFLGLSDRTLEKHRMFGTGPTFLKLGGRVVYTMDDLTRWAAKGCRKSTAAKGLGRILPTTRRLERPGKGPAA